MPNGAGRMLSFRPDRRGRNRAFISTTQSRCTKSGIPAWQRRLLRNRERAAKFPHRPKVPVATSMSPVRPCSDSGEATPALIASHYWEDGTLANITVLYHSATDVLNFNDSDYRRPMTTARPVDSPFTKLGNWPTFFASRPRREQSGIWFQWKRLQRADRSVEGRDRRRRQIPLAGTTSFDRLVLPSDRMWLRQRGADDGLASGCPDEEACPDITQTKFDLSRE